MARQLQVCAGQQQGGGCLAGSNWLQLLISPTHTGQRAFLTDLHYATYKMLFSGSDAQCMVQRVRGNTMWAAVRWEGQAAGWNLAAPCRPTVAAEVEQCPWLAAHLTELQRPGPVHSSRATGRRPAPHRTNPSCLLLHATNHRTFCPCHSLCRSAGRHSQTGCRFSWASPGGGRSRSSLSTSSNEPR